MTNFSFAGTNGSSISFFFSLIVAHLFLSFFSLTPNRLSLFLRAVRRRRNKKVVVQRYVFSQNTKLRVRLPFFYKTQSWLSKTKYKSANESNPLLLQGVIAVGRHQLDG